MSFDSRNSTVYVSLSWQLDTILEPWAGGIGWIGDDGSHIPQTGRRGSGGNNSRGGDEGEEEKREVRGDEKSLQAKWGISKKGAEWGMDGGEWEKWVDGFGGEGRGVVV